MTPYNVDSTEKQKETLPDRFLNVIFKLRAWIIIIGILFIVLLAIWLKFWRHHDLKDIVTVVVGGFGIIALFFNIINVYLSHEANHTKIGFDRLKFENDKTYAKLTFSFSMCAEWYKSLNQHSMFSWKFINEQQSLIKSGSMGKFYKELSADKEARQALAAVLNYFESVCSAIEKGLVDEQFMEDFFHSLFASYYKNLKEYIVYRRRLDGNNDRLFDKFFKVTERWQKK